MTDENNADNADTEKVQEEASLSLNDINTIVNQAISSRFKSFEKKFEDFTTSLNNNPIVEKKDKPSSDMQNLKNQLELLQKERDSEVVKRKDVELRNTAKEVLLKSGISSSMLKPAMSILIDSDKLVGYDEDDKLIYRTNTGDVDLEIGLKSWLKEDGKLYMAPKGAQGSGDRSFGPSKNSQEMSRADIGAVLEAALLNGDLDE